MLLFLTLAGGLLQSLLPGIPAMGMAKTPVLLCVSLYFAVERSREWTVAAALAAGLLQDALSLLPVGYSAFVFCLLGLAVHPLAGLVIKDSPGTAAMLCGVGAVVGTALLYAMLTVGTDYVPAPWSWVLLKIGGTGLLGAVAAPAIWAFARRLDRVLGNAPADETHDGKK